VRVRNSNAMKVAQPRQVCRLIDGNDHVPSDHVLGVLYI
jgi:hypothetical protein